MRFNTGDIVFTPDGRPALVTGRKETGHIVVDRKGEKLDKARKNGIINGLSSQDRQKFNEVVNKAKEQPAPENRVKEIQAKVDEIDGKPQNWILKRYLNGEMAYIMNSERVHPQTFDIDKELIS